ncbi:restriction endonuclease [Gordonia rubripertincta]|uniref:Restriction endonuclease n=1 Tax=Gordonia rubripertincta TaxID=36822 RepID=A0AAW4G0B6_GORRU|nr:restriction endonuclease [Gordonia rubripertincta]MBM7276702.1 restriction endonuclease [Gordonia rubripertincta]
MTTEDDATTGVADEDDELAGNLIEEIRERATRTTREEANRAEIVATQIMRKIGFADAQQTQRASDQGRDIVASGAIAEVKWKSAPAGRPDTQKLGGALLREQRLFRRNDKMLFFSKSGFSPHAVSYADDVSMALFEFGLDGKAKAVNKHAMPYRQRYPAVVTGSVPARRTPQPSRLSRLAEGIVTALLVFVVLVVAPLATVAGAGLALYLGIRCLTTGSIPAGLAFLALGTALAVVIVLAFRWFIREPGSEMRAKS